MDNEPLHLVLAEMVTKQAHFVARSATLPQEIVGSVVGEAHGW
ncbi:hypothetical protein [Mycobacterium leprae]|nr:hypothetical protein [Mycobacterium leprae]